MTVQGEYNCSTNFDVPADVPKETDPNEPDPYIDAIAKAFTTELTKENIQLKAMVGICTKLHDLESRKLVERKNA